jgi:hypothetical protein
MGRGAAERVRLDSVAELAVLIEELTPSQALALGALRADLPDRVEVTTKRKLLNGVAQPDIIARTGSNIIYNGPAYALLDFDSKGMPVAVEAELKRAGNFWNALLGVLPALGKAARLVRSVADFPCPAPAAAPGPVRPRTPGVPVRLPSGPRLSVPAGRRWC